MSLSAVSIALLPRLRIGHAARLARRFSRVVPLAAALALLASQVETSAAPKERDEGCCELAQRRPRTTGGRSWTLEERNQGTPPATKAHLRRRRVHTSGALSFVRASTSDAAVWMPPLVDGPQRVAPGVDGDQDDEMLSNFGMSLRRIAAALTRFARTPNPTRRCPTLRPSAPWKPAVGYPAS